MWNEIYPEFKGRVIKGLHTWEDLSVVYFLITCEDGSQLMITLPKVNIERTVETQPETSPEQKQMIASHFGNIKKVL
jgi:hypothetical protein